jgi:hypothetical protein
MTPRLEPRLLLMPTPYNKLIPIPRIRLCIPNTLLVSKFRQLALLDIQHPIHLQKHFGAVHRLRWLDFREGKVLSFSSSSENSTSQ